MRSVRPKYPGFFYDPPYGFIDSVGSAHSTHTFIHKTLLEDLGLADFSNITEERHFTTAGCLISFLHNISDLQWESCSTLSDFSKTEHTGYARL